MAAKPSKAGMGDEPHLKNRASDSREEKVVDFRKIGAIIEKNFIVMTRDKIRLIPLLAFPIMMILVIGYTSGNTPKHIAAAVVAYDSSPLSQDIVAQISGSQYFSVRHLVSTEGEARQLLDEGKVRVIIEIPPDLQDKIDAGSQASLTIIVDESDSSVAATSRQVMANIVRQASNQLAVRQLRNYQATVALAGDRLSSYSQAMPSPSTYAVIAQSAGASQAQLDASRKLVDFEAQALLASTPSAPSQVMVSGRTVIDYQGNRSFLENDTLLFLESSQYNAVLGQVALLRQSSMLDEQAKQSAKGIAKSASDSLAQAQSLRANRYQSDVVASLDAIHVFAQADPMATLEPLILEEKPAYGTGKNITDFLIPSLIALTLFQGAVMGMGRAVAGEKRDGSLTRVFLTPTSNTTIIMGTIVFYVIFELIRATFLVLFSVVLFNVTVEGSLFLMLLVMVIYVAIAIAIGMILSTLVKTEQQYMAMSMLVSFPTMFLAGVFFPVQAMPKFMQALAAILPVTYASDALRSIMVKGLGFSAIAAPLGILLIFLAVFLVGVMIFFKRDIE